MRAGVYRRERFRVARHEAVHVGVAHMLDAPIDEVLMMPPPRGHVARFQGECSIGPSVPPIVRAVIHAAGTVDGHGAGHDEEQLRALCPDETRRAEVVALAVSIMEHAEFVRVRDRVARRLLFEDRLDERELRKIIEWASA